MPATQRACRSVARARGRDRGLLHPGLVTAVLLLALPVVPARAAPAPDFRLPRLDGRGAVSAADLFAAHEHTFLVFWWSGCTHCRAALASCEAFHREQSSGLTAVVGIDGEDTGVLEARAVVAAQGATFLQLRDPGGAIAATYGLPSGTPAVCLVDRDGEIVDVRIDPPGDVSSTMRAMHGQAVAGGSPEAASPGVVLSAWQRIRFLGIDARGPQASGAYGEPLDAGNSLDYRLEVEAAKRLRPDIRVGGLLRIGTEGQEALDSGPKYFGSEWGSVFAAYDGSHAGVRLGYYTLFMTPFTLMRWDWDDSPRLGGSAGCGCSAAGGMLRIENLDDLGPDLTFEGGLGHFGVGDFEARVFYAMPQRALGTSYTSWRTAGEPRAHYAQQLYGLEVRWQRQDARTRGAWEAGLHVAGTWEDHRSVDFLALGYPAPDPWTETLVATATAGVPVARFARLRGEVVAWNHSEVHVALPDGTGLDLVSEGGGGLGGLVYERPGGLEVALDYLRLDGDFSVPYAALSYEPDQEGMRLSAQLPVPGERGVVSLFYKRARQVDPPSDAVSRSQWELWGVSWDAPVRGALGAGAGWIDDRRWRSDDVAPLGSRRQALVARVHYDFGRFGVAELEYQRTRTEDDAPGADTESIADVYIVQTTADF